MLKQFGVVAGVVMVIIVSVAITMNTYETGKNAADKAIKEVDDGIQTVQIIEFEQPEIVTQ